MLFSTPKLDTAEIQVVEKIDEIRKQLNYALSTPLLWTGLLRRITFARAIMRSNSIEGHNVSLEDAIAAVDEEPPFDAAHEDWLAISGYRAAMTYILQLSNDPDFAFQEALLRSLHYMMIGFDLKKRPGRYRPGVIYVRHEPTGDVVYEGPDSTSVPKLMQELIEEMKAPESNVPVMVRAAMGHLNLVMIHPFADGNGRMARALQTLILSHEGILASPFSSIEEYLGRNTPAYYAVLGEVGGGKWQPERDARPWIRFCLRAHYHQANRLLRRTRELDRLWNELETEIVKHELPERVIFALADAATPLKVRSATYRSAVEDITPDVASRDLKMLVKEKLLVAHGKNRGRYYTASPLITKIRQKTREPWLEDDPFTMTIQPPSASLFLPGLEPIPNEPAQPS